MKTITTMKNLLLLPMFMTLITVGCSSDDFATDSYAKTDSLTIDYYGKPIPYTPVAEEDMPEWLRILIHQKDGFGIYRICTGTIKGETVYHVNNAKESSLLGRFYDKDGNGIGYPECKDYPSQIENVVCIYYHRFGDEY